MKRGEVWLVRLDPAVGSETQKTRPGVIFSNDSANRHLPRITIVPVTSNTSKLYAAEAAVSIEGRQGKAMCDQIRTLDKARLIRQMGQLTTDELTRLETALCVALALPLP